ncbi:hypothetical protein BHE17_12295 [Planococcus maritimus]|nr:hypothetical protein BHE17_12295 [Planococcus maritimus]
MFKAYIKFIEKYGSLLIAAYSLIYLLTSWGDNWVLTWILLAALIISPIIGISDIRESKSSDS